MTEIIHERETDSSGSGMGFLFGLIVVILFMYVLFAYGLPYLRGGGNSTGGNPTVNVPGQIDVNLNNKGGGQQ